jgi:hypothetical protein
MAQQHTPNDTQVNEFLGRLREYRNTLGESDQHLLDSMVAAALGKKPESEDEVKPFWVAYNPPGLAGGVGYGYAAGGPYGAVGFNATPWGTAYGYRY